MNKKAVVIGSSKGIGKSFREELISNGYITESLSTKEVDTNSIKSIENFIEQNKNNYYDFLVLNTGGLPPVEEKASPNEIINSIQNASQNFFESQIKIFFGLNLNPNSTVVFISSHVVVNIEKRLISSAIARASMEKFMEYIGQFDNYKSLNMISLRFGPVLTDRLNNLLKSNKSSKEKLAQSIKQEKVADTDDVKRLANLIINSKALFGSGTYNFDSGIGLIKSASSL